MISVEPASTSTSTKTKMETNAMTDFCNVYFSFSLFNCSCVLLAYRNENEMSEKALFNRKADDINVHFAAYNNNNNGKRMFSFILFFCARWQRTQWDGSERAKKRNDDGKWEKENCSEKLFFAIHIILNAFWMQKSIFEVYSALLMVLRSKIEGNKKKTPYAI